MFLVRAKDGHQKDGNVDVYVSGACRVCEGLAAQLRRQDYSKVTPKVRASGLIVEREFVAARMAGDVFIRATMLERNILGDVGYAYATRPRPCDIGHRHPFILKLYHSFQEKDRLVMIVDYCVGGSVHYHVNLSVR